MPTPPGARSRYRALFLAALLTTACGEPAATDDDSAAANAGETRIQLEEVATIGCATCPRLEQVSVFAMGMDADGLIWAVDRYAPHMRVFRTNGELVAAFGPTGEGPGDFRTGPMDSMISGHAVLAEGNGRVLVYQKYPAALVGLDLDGNAISNLPLEINNPLNYATLGLVRDPTAPRAFMLSRGVGAAGDGEPFAVHRLDFGEESVGFVQIAAGTELFSDADPGALRRRWVSIAAAPDGTLALGDSLTYKILWLDAEGTVLGSFVHAAERPLKSEDALVAQRRSARRRGESEDGVDIYDMHFWRNAFEFDDDGRLWVLLNRPTRERSVFDIFAADGTHLQQLDVPYHIQRYNLRGSDPAFVITGGYLAATVVGPDDEGRIKVWRVIDE